MHATLSRNAVRNLEQAQFREIVCTNTQPIPPEKRLPNMRIMHLGGFIARVIDAVHRGNSVGETLRSFEADCD